MRVSTLKYRLSKYEHPFYKLKIIEDPMPRVIILDEKEHIAETIKTHEILTVIYTLNHMQIIKPGGMICMLPIYTPQDKKIIKFQKYIPNLYVSLNLNKKSPVRLANDFGFEMLYYEDKRYYLCVLESYLQCCDYASSIGFNFNSIEFCVCGKAFLIKDITGYNYSGDTLIIEIHPDKMLLLPLNKKEVRMADFKSLNLTTSQGNKI